MKEYEHDYVVMITTGRGMLPLVVVTCAAVTAVERAGATEASEWLSLLPSLSLSLVFRLFLSSLARLTQCAG